MNESIIAHKWIVNYTRKVSPSLDLQKTLYRPLEWNDTRFGYLHTRYNTSINSMIEQIIWTIGYRIDPEILYNTLLELGHEFTNVWNWDTTVCTTIEFENRIPF